jgi:serine/threonine protein kinase
LSRAPRPLGRFVPGAIVSLLVQQTGDSSGGSDPLLGERLGGYDIEAVIGRGAFATVYRARQVQLRRDVALKVLDPVVGRDPLTARRFAEEARRAAELDHPSIVPVFDAGEDRGLAYLAMRLIAGWSLAEELRKDGRPSPARTLEVTTHLAAALDHSHARGVVHRDVKPDNVLLEPGRVWLADFGIAATVQTAGQYTTGAIGTASYMAPEQSQAGPIDGRADLYALGCVVYECLTGAPPFPGSDFARLLLAHSQAPVPGTGWLPTDTFIVRALAKNPDDRYQNGNELVSALSAALAGERLAAPPARKQEMTGPPPPPPPGRRRWWQR